MLLHRFRYGHDSQFEKGQHESLLQGDDRNDKQPSREVVQQLTTEHTCGR